MYPQTSRVNVFGQTRLGQALLLAVLCVALSQFGFAGATVTIINANAPGVGFNDPTPATPVGGNTGTTVGEQRLIAFQFAANVWGSTLESNVEIRVSAQFTALSCTANSGTLGSAGATQSRANFTNAALANTWYPIALANKMASTDLLAGGAHITANFNSNVGATGCLEGSGWYYGLDTNTPSNRVNLVAVVLHELAHGLGFSLGLTTLSTGQHAQGMPTVYERGLFDRTTGKFWVDMSDGERTTSAVNTSNVVWTGSNVTAAAPNVLGGTPLLQVTAPQAIAGNYAVGTASFGAALTATPVSGAMLLATDAADAEGPTTTDACTTITNGAQLAGKIALVDRGTCTFVVKAQNVQAAGAIAMVVADHTAGSPPPGLGGSDPSITIPAVRITQADGTTIKGQLSIPTTVNVLLVLNMNQLAGADAQGRVVMNAPNPLQSGSSISHWDPATSRNQLMEPNISDDLTHSVKEPEDLTLALFKDIGWTVAVAAPSAAFSGNSVAFGNSLMGYGSFSTTLTVSNPGSAALTISSVSVSGSTDFTRVNNCPGSLAASASCTVTVTFNPSSPGVKTGTLTITTNAAGSPHAIALSGTGTTDLVFSLSRTQRPARNGGGAANVFELAIAPGSGFEGNVRLGCSGKEADIGCTIQPGSVFVAGAPVAATVTVNAAGRSLRLRRSTGAVTSTIRVTATTGGVTRAVEFPIEVRR